MRIISHSEQDTYKAGALLGASLSSGAVVALRGDLGAGKTVFVKGLASALGVSGDVHSPTFAILNEHDGPLPLHHFDVYRVKDEGDLYSTGFFDIAGADGVTAIEWSERIEGLLPADTVTVTIERGDGDDTRIITIEGGDLR